MSEQNTTAGQGLGIAGFVLGILAIPLGIIPCTFIAALIFGITGIILSSVGLSHARRSNGAKGLIIAALVCSIIGTTFAFFWSLTLGKGSRMFQQVIKEQFHKETGKEFEKAFKSFGEDMEEVLKDLEEGLEGDSTDNLTDTLKKYEKEVD